MSSWISYSLPPIKCLLDNMIEREREYCVPALLTDCWSAYINLSFDHHPPQSAHPKRGHLTSAHNEGKWGNDAWKCSKCLIHLIVIHLLWTSQGQPPRGSVSFRGESNMSHHRKYYSYSIDVIWLTASNCFACNLGGLVLRLKLAFLCGCETVALQWSLILMQLLVCLWVVFSLD